jgi:hypothetical protein
MLVSHPAAPSLYHHIRHHVNGQDVHLMTGNQEEEVTHSGTERHSSADEVISMNRTGSVVSVINRLLTCEYMAGWLLFVFMDTAPGNQQQQTGLTGVTSG